MRVALVSCGKAKTYVASSASELYTSGLFRAAKRYAELHFDKWYVLSAKHGLLDPTSIVEPYEVSLSELPRVARSEWAIQVTSMLASELPKPAYIELLAGQLYSAVLRRMLEAEGHLVGEPLTGLGLGHRGAWLKSSAESNLTRVKRVLTAFEQSGRLRKFSDVKSSDCPKQGVYIFFDPLDESSSNFKRVVRVGTHAVSSGSRSTLWSRLKAHRGTSDGGNHRSSIFRLHVGAALIAKLHLDCPTWGVGQSASREVVEAERFVERLVSDYIGKLLVTWVEIDDPASRTSDRLIVEESLIALFAASDQEHRGESWLGDYSPKREIISSGLWNVRATASRQRLTGILMFEYFGQLALKQAEVPKESVSSLFGRERSGLQGVLL